MNMRDLVQKQRKRRKEEEFRFHCAVASYLEYAIKAPDWWTTFPAGGGGKARGGKLKAAGLKPGVPDILIIKGMNGVAHWIELKSETGIVGKTQIEMARTIENARGHVAVCRTLDDVTAALRAWSFNLRARAA